MNIQQARSNMLTQQIRSWGVYDEQIFAAMAAIPREQFVPLAFQQFAFADMAIPLAHDESMMTPMEEGRLLQELKINCQDKVLEIGTGSGYLTALLAKLAKRVVSIDLYADFIESAKNKCSNLGLRHIELQIGDGAHGWRQYAPYDVIVITGSLPYLPDEFRHDLAIGGRLFAIIGSSPAMQAVLITRESQTKWQQHYLFETDIKPLRNADQMSTFVF